jgi:hypothetical protein
MQTALNTAIVELEGNAVIAYTPTNYVKEVINHENKLMEEIRSSLHKNDLILNVKVDVKRFPDYEETSAVKLRLSQREIYNEMVKINPHLQTLVTTLKLKLEGE